MTNEDFMERICVELTELNANLNSRFDALDVISCGVHLIREELNALHHAVDDLADRLTE